jgi:hypothetical protein
MQIIAALLIVTSAIFLTNERTYYFTVLFAPADYLTKINVWKAPDEDIETLSTTPSYVYFTRFRRFCQYIAERTGAKRRILFLGIDFLYYVYGGGKSL